MGNPLAQNGHMATISSTETWGKGTRKSSGKMRKVLQREVVRKRREIVRMEGEEKW